MRKCVVCKGDISERHGLAKCCSESCSKALAARARRVREGTQDRPCKVCDRLIPVDSRYRAVCSDQCRRKLNCDLARKSRAKQGEEHRVKRQKLYAARRDEIRKRKRELYAANPEKYKTTSLLWRQKNRDRVRQRDKIRNARRSEKNRENCKSYYQTNREKILAEKRTPEYRERQRQNRARVSAIAKAVRDLGIHI